MAKRLTEIDRIMQYLETAPIDSARTVLEIGGAVIRRRAHETEPAKPITERKKRTPKAAGQESLLGTQPEAAAL